jgi:hypothetical protein
MLATYMARHPERVNVAMQAAYNANQARKLAYQARKLAANNAAHH